MSLTFVSTAAGSVIAGGPLDTQMAKLMQACSHNVCCVRLLLRAASVLYPFWHMTCSRSDRRFVAALSCSLLHCHYVHQAQSDSEA